ncbi:MAG: hypothetical protein HXY27_02585 [Hydrogenophilaceae bacterium]|nr:hypothetical protein [Hydrogenophilaceae bacterium]
MAAVLPVYEVEFIPLERRLGDRRTRPNAGLPAGVVMDRRAKAGRRREDQPKNTLKVI